MISPMYSLLNLVICLMLLCTLMQSSSSQPLLNDDNDADQIQLYDEILNDNLPVWGRFNIPESLSDSSHHRQMEQYHPENIHLAKRIIMLPRVGRRSISSQ